MEGPHRERSEPIGRLLPVIRLIEPTRLAKNPGTHIGRVAAAPTRPPPPGNGQRAGGEHGAKTVMSGEERSRTKPRMNRST